MTTLGPTNDAIADVLVAMAGLLEEQAANPYRVRAYLRAAETVRGEARPLVEMLNEGGLKKLQELAGVGENLALHIARFILTGRVRLMDRLQGASSPEELFASVPGIGEDTARRIHRELGIGSLEDLERAAHDGRLEAMEGMGPRRVQALREQLNSILSRRARRRMRQVRRAVIRLQLQERTSSEPEWVQTVLFAA